MAISPEGWLSLEETAGYLRMGKTVLYALARDGRIPARKIGKKWTLRKSGVGRGLRATSHLNSFFLNLDLNIENNEILRDPQRDGYLRTYEFFRAGRTKPILQIAGRLRQDRPRRRSCRSASPKGRVIVIAPNLTIKDGLYKRWTSRTGRSASGGRAGVLSRHQDDGRATGLHARQRQHLASRPSRTSSSRTSISSPPTSTSG